MGFEGADLHQWQTKIGQMRLANMWKPERHTPQKKILKQINREKAPSHQTWLWIPSNLFSAWLLPFPTWNFQCHQNGLLRHHEMQKEKQQDKAKYIVLEDHNPFSMSCSDYTPPISSRGNLLTSKICERESRVTGVFDFFLAEYLSISVLWLSDTRNPRSGKSYHNVILVEI